MTNTLEKYLAEGAQPHEFRLKIACEATDEQLDAMETHLRKYDAFDITTPKRTIMQRNPRDFRSINAAEVFMIDFKTHQPAAPQHLLAELTQKMGIHERHMIVRNKAEPMHIEDEGTEHKEEEYKTRLEDPDYSEVENPKAENYYGEQFKANFIKEIAKERKDLTKEHKD
jgi:hypothetical protein